MKPSLTHIIGISEKTKNKYQNEINKFLDENFELEFNVFAKELIKKYEDPKDLRQRTKKLFVFDLIHNYEKGSAKIFGIKPISNFENSHMYNNELLWCLLETEMLNAMPVCKKVPYLDLSEFINKDYSYIKSKIEDKNLVRQLSAYDGDWARQYSNFPLYQFDADFDFALNFFHSINIPIEKHELDRYTIFEWF